MEEHLAGLNKKQREAALHTAGPLLIVAGAGAGKTKTITHRIVNLIKEGVAPEKILAVTFTNKAAKEMRERIGEAVLRYGGLGRSDDDGQRKFEASNFRAYRAQNRGPFVSTFHSLGVYIIKENARMLGLTKYFTILDESDSTALVKEAMKELGLDIKQYDPRRIKGIISREKGNFVDLEKYSAGERDPASDGASHIGKMVMRVWSLYEKKKGQENSLDFDDLLLKATKLLKENEKIRQIYQEKWTHIHIDEYQDTNEVQYLMSRLLTGEEKNICVVGDADQNIYSWRGANLKNILSFEKDYPECKIVLLEENYRSTKNILEAANKVIKKNKYRPEKNLFTENAVGEKISIYEALDENDEAEFVATKVLELIDSRGSKSERTLRRSDGDGERKFEASNFRGESGLAPSDIRAGSENILSDIAFLYRANFQSRALEEAMLRYNIPYQVLGVKFFERKEIKDTLAYLRAALNPKSLSDIKRIINFPTRGIGKTTLLKIFAQDMESLPIKMKLKIESFYKLLEEIKEKISSKGGSASGGEKASEIIKFVVKRSGIEEELQNGDEEEKERLENIKELATLALKYDNLANGAGIERLLEDAALASDQDSLIERSEKKEVKNGVKLMTVHASKGLEFKYVFITGLEDGLFPHTKDGEIKTAEDGEEERRLFYVALTRAKEKLFLSFANFRTIFGSRSINAPSEFLADIPPQLLEKEGEQKIKTIYI